MSDRREQIRWGVVGPGRIAAKVMSDLALVDGGVLHAVASRAPERARAFAHAHGAPAAYGSYAELLADPDVDVVYVATPHRQHHAVALAAIEAGKHLLVEKAFTCTLAGAKEVVDAARAAGIFCMEAMWTRFQPVIVKARRLLADGVIGEVRSVRAELGFRMGFDPRHRLWDPSQGGGALLDLGVYPVAFVQSVLGGTPARVEVIGSRAENGVDAESVVVWGTDDGRSGTALCSLLGPLPGSAGVFGTGGWLEVAPPFHHPTSIRVHAVNQRGRVDAPELVEAPVTGYGYAHELEEVHRCIAEGRTESPAMPLADTLVVMEVVDRALQDLGVRHDEATDVL